MPTKKQKDNFTPSYPCAAEDCRHPAHYKAPLSPDQPHTLIWLCLDHVRAHNAAWDAFTGFSETEIERLIRFDTVWERLSWPFGKGPLPKRTEQKHSASLPSPVIEAFKTLGIKPTLCSKDVKTRYRALAKEYHPDMNKGRENASSTVFHKIQRAFTTIEKFCAKQKNAQDQK